LNTSGGNQKRQELIDHQVSATSLNRSHMAKELQELRTKMADMQREKRDIESRLS